MVHCAWPSVLSSVLAAALLLIPAVGGCGAIAAAQGTDPLAVVLAYQAASNARDLDAVAALFAYDGRATVLGGLSTATMVRRDGLRNRLLLQSCPAGATCRMEMSNHKVTEQAAQGSTIAWDHRFYSTAAPPELDPWEATGEATVRDSKILFLQLTRTPEWDRRWRAVEDVRLRAESLRLAGDIRSALATATARAAPAATAAAEAKLREPRPPDTQLRTMPSIAMWGGGGALLVLTAAWAAVRRAN